MRTREFEQSDDGPLRVRTGRRGRGLLGDALLNKGTGFTPEERRALGLEGLLPDSVSSLEEQVSRVHGHFERKTDPLEKYIGMIALQDRNEGTGTVQVLTRHWIITDGDGHVQEVRGPGVVGQQPSLSAGQSFEYTSFCPLQTSFGTMHGTFQMVTDDRETFDAEIAPFPLGEPHSIN